MAVRIAPALQDLPVDKIVFGHLAIDTRRRLLLVDGAPVELQSRAFDILQFLVAARDRVVSRDEIVAQVWRGNRVAVNNLTVQMSILRRALSDNGADGLIITIPGQGYRFVGEAVDVPPPPPCGGSADEAVAIVRTRECLPVRAAPPPSQPAGVTLNRRGLVITGFGGMGIAVCGIFAWHHLIAPAPLSMAALVSVAASPDEVLISPGGIEPVDYVFSILSRGDLQLETEDWRFLLPSGEPIGEGRIGNRIFHGSFPIQGGTTGVYHNHIYLPPDIAERGRTNGGGVVQLKHVFHLRDVGGREVAVPAVLRILIRS